MQLLQPIQNLLNRVTGYPIWEVALELLVIWVLVYALVRFVQGTRAAGAMKGMLVIFLVLLVLARLLSGGGDDGGRSLQRIAYLYDKLAALVALGLVVVFQPELRRALIRVGEASFFRSSPTEVSRVIDAIEQACKLLSRAKFGGIIAIERQAGLGTLADTGTKIGAEVSAPLLQTIFYPGTALHDLAVIIRGTVVAAAGVQLPMAEPGDMPDPSFGARHRAAVGLTKECDAIVVVVSEETGNIRIAERGKLSRPLDHEELRAELKLRLATTTNGKAKTAAEEATERILEAAEVATTVPTNTKETSAKEEPKQEQKTTGEEAA
ncbi:MAG: TIGR00159 family protein [Phycisphaeraceae bacterium]|nr:diadenylate cyclase CdaA [Phycisphaerales bacterium]MCB9859602.1 TIGR00159 family protein [Phycisphaeraceae bacterium]